MMTPKDLLDTMLGYLGFVVQIEETTNEGGNPTLQIYTEESRRLIGRNGETLEAIGRLTTICAAPQRIDVVAGDGARAAKATPASETV